MINGDQNLQWWVDKVLTEALAVDKNELDRYLLPCLKCNEYLSIFNENFG